MSSLTEVLNRLDIPSTDEVVPYLCFTHVPALLRLTTAVPSPEGVISLIDTCRHILDASKRAIAHSHTMEKNLVLSLLTGALWHGPRPLYAAWSNKPFTSTSVESALFQSESTVRQI